MRTLRDGLSRRGLLISAPAGYGKTSLMAELARDLDWPVAWYTLTEDGRDTGTLFASLIAAIDQARPGVTFTAREVLGSLTDRAISWRPVANALINDLAQAAPDPMLIVLDDVHLVADAETADVPGYLLAHLPAWIRVALLSRVSLRSPEIARMTGQGQLLLLDGQALAFRPDEIARFLEASAGAGLSPHEIALVHVKTEGWPLAVELLRQALLAGGRPSVIDTLATLRADRRELYEYFGTQVLDRLPADLRRLLLRISVLDPIDSDVCEVIAGVPDGRGALRDLEAHGVFLTPLDADGRRYRLHALFRETLQAHLERQEGPEEVRRLHCRAGEFLGASGRPFDAIPLLLRGRDYEAAVRYLEAHGERWLQEGRARTLADWIGGMPRATVEGSSGTLLLQGWLAGFQGDLHAAAHWFSSAIRIATGDAAGTARYGYASALEALHRYAEARAICETALARPDLSLRTQARLLRRMASAQAWSGLPVAATHLHERALALFEEAQDLAGQTQVLHELTFLGHHLDLERDWPARLLPRATMLHREAQHLGTRTDAALVLAELLGEQREPRALAFLEEAREGASRLDDARRLLLAHTTQGFVLLRLGRLSDAAQVFRDGIRFGEAQRADAFVQIFRAGLGRVAWKEGRAAEGTDLLRDVVEQCRARRFLLLLPSNQVSLALATADAGNLDEARTQLQEARDLFHRWGAGRRAAECALYLTALDVREFLTRVDAGRLADALGDAQRYRLDDRIAEHSTLISPLLARAIVEGIETEFTGAALAAHGTIETLAPVLAHPDPNVRLRGLRVLARMAGEGVRLRLHHLSRDPDLAVRGAAQASLTTLVSRPPVPLTVRLLGGFEVRKGETLLPSTMWRRKRGRLLFAFLLITARPVARDAVLETLWPDSPPAAAGASLNVAWSELKRALEPGLPERLSSSYLKMEGGAYGLRRSAVTTDVERFEEAVALAARATDLDARVVLLQRAAGLYGGDLLPEEANEPWTTIERERLRLVFLSTLEHLADGEIELGRGPEAVDTLRALLRLEPWREDAYRRLMRTLAGMGRRAEALHLYRQCEALLRREIGAAPSPETTALFEAIAEGGPV